MRLGAALLLAALAAAASAGEIYHWKDREGRANYADTPPPGNTPARTLSGRTTEIPLPPQPENAQGVKSGAAAAAEEAVELRKRQAQAADKQAQAEKVAADAAEKRSNCERARNQLAALESGQRMARFNDKGEREFLDDAQRAQETEIARKAADSWCK